MVLLRGLVLGFLALGVYGGALLLGGTSCLVVAGESSLLASASHPASSAEFCAVQKLRFCHSLLRVGLFSGFSYIWSLEPRTPFGGCEHAVHSLTGTGSSL